MLNKEAMVCMRVACVIAAIAVAVLQLGPEFLWYIVEPKDSFALPKVYKNKLSSNYYLLGLRCRVSTSRPAEGTKRSIGPRQRAIILT